MSCSEHPIVVRRPSANGFTIVRSHEQFCSLSHLTRQGDVDHLQQVVGDQLFLWRIILADQICASPILHKVQTRIPARLGVPETNNCGRKMRLKKIDSVSLFTNVSRKGGLAHSDTDDYVRELLLALSCGGRVAHS